MFPGGLLAGLTVGDPRSAAQAQEVYSMIDSIFLCSALEDAHVLAMNEMDLDGPRPLPEEVQASFLRKSRAIFSTGSQRRMWHGAWLEMVRLCLCAEVLRHLRPPPPGYVPTPARVADSGEGGSGAPPNNLSGLFPAPFPLGRAPWTVTIGERPGGSGAASALAPIAFTTSHVGGGPMFGESPAAGRGVVFVSDWPHHPPDRFSINIRTGPAPWGAPFRHDPLFLRGRVGSLLEVLLITESQNAPVQRGLTAEEMDQHCPAHVRSSCGEGCCPICLEDPVVGESVRRLPCGHEFHKECCEAWLQNASTCPTCRFQIPRVR